MVYFDKIVLFVHYYDPLCSKLMLEVPLPESVYDIYHNDSPKI
jgi:hypothetical protein